MNQNEGYKCSACGQWVGGDCRGKRKEQIFLSVVTIMMSGGYYHDTIARQAATPDIAARCLCEMAEFFTEFILNHCDQMVRGNK